MEKTKRYIFKTGTTLSTFFNLTYLGQQKWKYNFFSQLYKTILKVNIKTVDNIFTIDLQWKNNDSD